ncbi:MAG TPA: hypothetical protein VLT83_09320 [Opitutaceae bacterium]|nr:hypothetical protein [Opitutaceae bacterium]
MNRALVILVGLSLAAALAIAVIVVAPGKGVPRSAGGMPAAANRGSAAGGMTAPAGGADAAAVSAGTEVRVADAWRRLQSDDLKTLVANLRAAGFPPEVIRAVVAAMLHEQFAARRRQIMGDEPEVPYWRPGSMASFYASPQMSALRQLAREEQETLKQLLGPDSATSELSRLYQKRMYGELAADKIDAVQRIQQDYNDLRAQIIGEAGGGAAMLPWDREKLALLDKEQHDDLATVLSADELRQYDLRSSNTAQRLRNQLTYFNPTEQEFLAIYDLQSQFDETHNPMLMGFSSPEQLRQRQADQQQLQNQIKGLLGDQRYQEYRQTTDNGFMAASRIASTLQLPPQNASATWTLEQSMQQQISAIRADRGLVPEQRQQALQNLTSQANQQLAALLTPAGADAYKQTAGGTWLRSLESSGRRPPGPPATGATTGTQSGTAAGH